MIAAGCQVAVENESTVESDVQNGTIDASFLPNTVGGVFQDLPSGRNTCTGTVVRNRCVVTAQHCGVTPGQTYFALDTLGRASYVRRVKVGVPGVDTGDGVDPDIAFIYLDPPRPGTNLLRTEDYVPIAIDRSKLDFPVRNATVVGYGAPNPSQKQVGVMDILGRGEPPNSRETSVNTYYGRKTDAGQQIKQGDSGGPLLVGGRLVGINRKTYGLGYATWTSIRYTSDFVDRSIDEFCAPLLNFAFGFDGPNGGVVDTVEGPRFPGKIASRGKTKHGRSRCLGSPSDPDSNCEAQVRGRKGDETILLAAHPAKLPPKPDGSPNRYRFERWVDLKNCPCADEAHATQRVCEVPLADYLRRFPDAEDLEANDDDPSFGMACLARYKEVTTDDPGPPPPPPGGGGPPVDPEQACEAARDALPSCTGLNLYGMGAQLAETFEATAMCMPNDPFKRGGADLCTYDVADGPSGCVNPTNPLRSVYRTDEGYWQFFSLDCADRPGVYRCSMGWTSDSFDCPVDPPPDGGGGDPPPLCGDCEGCPPCE